MIWTDESERSHVGMPETEMGLSALTHREEPEQLPMGHRVEVAFPGDPGDVAWVYLSRCPIRGGVMDDDESSILAIFCREGGKWSQIEGDFYEINDQTLDLICIGPTLMLASYKRGGAF